MRDTPPPILNIRRVAPTLLTLLTTFMLSAQVDAIRCIPRPNLHYYGGGYLGMSYPGVACPYGQWNEGCGFWDGYGCVEVNSGKWLAFIALLHVRLYRLLLLWRLGLHAFLSNKLILKFWCISLCRHGLRCPMRQSCCETIPLSRRFLRDKRVYKLQVPDLSSIIILPFSCIMASLYLGKLVDH